ncbi:MAG: pentapeptide repeat-containing protein [Rhodospirillales bacterium]|nr:pentapeptide repeat-containing protein [Rhodospirillales bacterium]
MKSRERQAERQRPDLATQARRLSADTERQLLNQRNEAERAERTQDKPPIAEPNKLFAPEDAQPKKLFGKDGETAAKLSEKGAQPNRSERDNEPKKLFANAQDQGGRVNAAADEKGRFAIEKKGINDALDESQDTYRQDRIAEQKANLLKAGLEPAKQGPPLFGTNQAGQDLSGGQLFKGTFRQADLRQSNLAGADLQSADLREADLTGASIAGANLKGANLAGAKGVRYNDFATAITDGGTKRPTFDFNA